MNQLSTIAILMTGISLLFAAQGFAQNQQDRSLMIDSFIDYRGSSSSIYQPPPISHIVPNFNTITYAIAYEKQDIIIRPRDEDGELKEDASSSLALSGYTVAPHLAISLKKIGIGFSIENSKNESRYSWANQFGTAFGYSQHSIVQASGLGFNLSSLPFDKLRKQYKLAFILGGKSLNVRHQFSDFVPSSASFVSEPRNVRYNILRYQAGANLNLTLLKSFQVIPWIDYSYTDINGATASFDEVKFGDNQLAAYKDDLRLFWQAYPSFRYGIDLSLKVFDVDIRIGSLLGSLARLGSYPPYIDDSSFNISFSFDQKGE